MNVLVTGCSRGLGLEVCKVLLKEGHTVYGVARTHSDDFKALETANTGRLFFKEYDLADSENIKKALFKEYITNEVALHGFVNNAAMAYDDIVTNLSLNSLRKMYDVNVFTPMIIAKFVIRNMILHKTRGAIVHVSSICVHSGYKGLSMYASSKGALEAFSKNIAREWGVKGIRSNCIVPGFMETAMSVKLTEEQRSKIYARTSLKGATNITSVAEMVAFLLSDKAVSVTGQSIHVDNGTI